MSEKVTLKRNVGYIDGHKHVFFAAGTEFDSEADAKQVSLLTVKGAEFETEQPADQADAKPKKAKKAKKAETPETEQHAE